MLSGIQEIPETRQESDTLFRPDWNSKDQALKSNIFVSLLMSVWISSRSGRCGTTPIKLAGETTQLIACT